MHLKSISSVGNRRSRESYRKRVDLLQREAVELRRVLFRTKMDLFMKANPNNAVIPFAYCDVNRQLLCTRAVRDLFSIEPAKELSLRELLHHIEKKDARHIFESLKSGTRLKDYKLTDVRSISVNSYPLFYGEIPVGVAMILQSPDSTVEPGKMYRFVRGILSIVKEMSREYNLITNRATSSDPSQDNYPD